jgi:hypothetical protein
MSNIREMLIARGHTAMLVSQTAEQVVDAIAEFLNDNDLAVVRANVAQLAYSDVEIVIIGKNN